MVTARDIRAGGGTTYHIADRVCKYIYNFRPIVFRYSAIKEYT